LEIFYGRLVYFVAIWFIYPRFGILDQEKSGNPAFKNIGLSTCRQNVQEYWIIDMQAERSGKSYNNLWRCHA
jgi:hypothetical protein